ncbi:MAG: EamA family transporter [Candidatus Parvarchaeota archaeon]|nr:EamA family transporter [Candidatus Jingweiarchaeum tengchongense]MCW1300099.1 EamA family transporter [Candidatus Jingweiarchaeum tengchongense]MCW1304453.1 EamA family transporter [Candidatus Jingweiarchaeum tengchongense]MCW1305620.1 EamA family transporter [Candidatus Jingweiarchaeum tengchongense]MCW1309259.1 EamA family transporter [Candidatus Jingweiarchaeum tengchongense]
MKLLDVSIGLAIAFLFGLCAFFQKFGLKEIEKFSITGMLKSKKWLIGIFFGAVGALLYVYAVKKIEITLLQPILNLSLIFPVVFGKVFLKEEMTKKELIGIIILIVGVLIIGL